MRCGQLPRALGREEVRIEHEQRDDLAAAMRLEQRRVIGEPQVLAAKPDERTHRGLLHYSRVAVLVTILTVAQLVYVVVLATWILFEKRSPVATLAWILALIALPYVGFVVFFLFGPRRLVRKRLKHKRARGAVTASTPLGASDPPPAQYDPRVEQLVHLVKRAGEPPASQCDAVEIFHDAATTYDAIEAAIREAKHHVHVAYYIFDPRRVGARFRDALIERAKAGVTVRLLVDDVGSSAMGRRFTKPMRDGRHQVRALQRGDASRASGAASTSATIARSSCVTASSGSPAA